MMRGATVRKCFDEKGKTLQVQPLGIITRIVFVGGENDEGTELWNANGIKNIAGRQQIFVDFGDGKELEQVQAAQLVLHREADMRAMDALKNKDATERANLLSSMERKAQEKPLKVDRLNLSNAPPQNPLEVGTKSMK